MTSKERRRRMEITAEQVKKIMPTAGARAQKYVTVINKWSSHFDIDTPLRMAHWLAQVAHESAELRYTKELASGKAYEGRKDLGNAQKGDGVRFKGRGLIQITGRANYAAYAKYCSFDVVAEPELLEQPLGAVKSAMWYWQTRGLNAWADKDDVLTITKRINGGTNGLASRKAYLERAKQVFNI